MLRKDHVVSDSSLVSIFLRQLLLNKVIFLDDSN